MDIGATLRAARERARLTQAELARRARTSQTAISAYEHGAKEPSIATLNRLLAAAGARLAVESAAPAVTPPSPRELARAGRTLAQVIELAETLPHRYEPQLRYPRLPSTGSGPR